MYVFQSGIPIFHGSYNCASVIDDEVRIAKIHDLQQQYYWQYCVQPLDRRARRPGRNAPLNSSGADRGRLPASSEKLRGGLRQDWKRRRITKQNTVPMLVGHNVAPWLKAMKSFWKY